jgi:hypothetical protein
VGARKAFRRIEFNQFSRGNVLGSVELVRHAQRVPDEQPWHAAFEALSP